MIDFLNCTLHLLSTFLQLHIWCYVPTVKHISKIETYTCFRSTFLSNQELTPFPSGRFAGPASSLYYVFFVNFRDIYSAAGLYISLTMLQTLVTQFTFSSPTQVRCTVESRRQTCSTAGKYGSSSVATAAPKLECKKTCLKAKEKQFSLYRRPISTILGVPSSLVKESGELKQCFVVRYTLRPGRGITSKMVDKTSVRKATKTRQRRKYHSMLTYFTPCK